MIVTPKAIIKLKKETISILFKYETNLWGDSSVLVDFGSSSGSLGYNRN